MECSVKRGIKPLYPFHEMSMLPNRVLNRGSLSWLHYVRGSSPLLTWLGLINLLTFRLDALVFFVGKFIISHNPVGKGELPLANRMLTLYSLLVQSDTVGINQRLCSSFVEQWFDNLIVSWVTVFWHCPIPVHLSFCFFSFHLNSFLMHWNSTCCINPYLK